MINTKYARYIIKASYYIALAGIGYQAYAFVLHLILFASDMVLITDLVYIGVTTYGYYLIRRYKRQLAGSDFKTWRSYN